MTTQLLPWVERVKAEACTRTPNPLHLTGLISYYYSFLLKNFHNLEKANRFWSVPSSLNLLFEKKPTTITSANILSAKKSKYLNGLAFRSDVKSK